MSQNSTRAAAASSVAPSTSRRRLGLLAAAAAAYTYLLIVFGGIVRITGSGLGCGDDWPRCHGHWIPPMSVETLIEYTHRLLAAGIFVPVLAVTLYAWRHRRDEGFGGAGGLLRPVALFLALLVVQVALGAVTVKMELPPSVTVLHFVTASSILAILLVLAVRGRMSGSLRTPETGRWARSAFIGATLGLLAITLGALTANIGAAPACQGFPLCNGSGLPAGGSLVHTHWTHRLIAYLLFLHVLGAAIAALRGSAPAAVQKAAVAALLLVIAQITIAAGMVLMHLPHPLQGLHLAAGEAVWGGLVVWTAVARRVPERLAAPMPTTAPIPVRGTA